MDWCKNGKVDTGYEIKTAKSQIEDLTATIGKSLADTDASRQRSRSFLHPSARMKP